jgi:drug/metabolite transporter (DMT)-like permease
LPRYSLLGLGVLQAGASTCAFFALERIPVPTFIVLFYTYPALVALMSAFLGERLPLQSWLALGLTLVGVALTAPDFSQGLGGEYLAGVLISLGNALIVGVMFMVSSRLLRGQAEFARASAWVVTGACLVFLSLTVVRQLGVPQRPIEWLGLLAMAGFSTVFAVFFLNSGIQKLGPTKASIIATVEPVFTTILAVLFLGDTIQPIQVLGGLLILTSLVILQRRPQPRPAPIAVE